MKRDHYQEQPGTQVYVDHCDCIIVLCVYHVTWNVIVDTIVNVISEVWMGQSCQTQTARNCVTGFSCMELFKIKPNHFDTV